MGIRKTSVFDVVNIIILSLIGFVTFYPLYNMYVYAFNDGLDSLRGVLYLWPRQPTLFNFRLAFQNERLFRSFMVSLARTGIGTFITLLCTSSMAYALSKRRMPGYKALSMFFFITFIFNGGLIPYFLTIRTLGLYDTFWILLIQGGIYSYWYMVLFRSFFASIPDSIEESVKIDGGSYATIFARMIVPLSKPVYAAIALFTAVGYWSEWFTGLFFIKNVKLVPLQTLLQKIMFESNAIQELMKMSGGNLANSNFNVTPNGLRLAIAVITITPIICVYPFLQKYFIKGIMLGSIKG
ncbi:MAG: carbohydrate ABC transporter permease [Defluviitaleaceae bacterium]|nr:carbohydrate ABC transporter permease [Defluviitaleaceae bacterium]